MNNGDAEFLTKLLLQLETETIAQGDLDYFVTLTSHIHPSKWVQLNACQINCSYPYAEDPESLAVASGFDLPSQVELSEWEPRSHVTYEYFAPSGNVSDISHEVHRCVDFCVRTLLKLDEPIAKMRLSEWE